MSKLSLSVEKPAPAAVVPIIPGATATGLSLPPGLSYEAWEGIGRTLGRVSVAHQWWVGDWWNYGEREYGERAYQAEILDVEPKTISNWAWVAGQYEPSLRREHVSFGHHAVVAKLPEPQRSDWLTQVLESQDGEHRGGMSVRDLDSAIKRARVAAGSAGNLPTGKYSVLLADPPWRYEFNSTDAARAIENHYPTLEADEIACLEDADGRPVADLAADDAVLFLWATNPKVAEALRVIEGWGFEYVTNLTWVKDRIGMGYWARQRHELLLVATRGDMSPPPEHLRPDSVIEFPRRAHSEKPPAVHEFIEAIWPDAPKIELFARVARPGWAVFGNQLPKAVA